MADHKKKRWSIGSIFRHADGKDMLLMALGLAGSVADGSSTPVVLVVSSRLMNTVGSAPSLSPETLRRNVNKNAVALLYLAVAIWVACFLEAYCWTRTAERQATRMRAKYLKAVLRQDVAYFDLHITTKSEVVTSVSNDSLLIQDVLSEKVPNFLVNITTFIGSYIAAFALLWRLALVGLPFMVFLVIPGLVYGRALIGIARKTREEYNKAGSVAEQAISAVRTVYSFVGESKAVGTFSAALEGCEKMGLRQGLAKGMAIGSNGIVFGIWAFMAYYGSRMVMDHGAQGGTVYVVGAGITFGGLALGSCLSDLKYFAEACSAAARIAEMIDRVPEIDSESKEGVVLDDISGEVEFRRVQFAYPSRPETMIFKDFSLKIPAGRTVALVGGSGSGKSTVISLLQRFYDPLSGDVLLDGFSIKKLQLKWLRSQMGLVSQEPVLFATTIKENILFGKEDAETEEVIEAAKSANVHNFITLLPQGYDTQVGEGGIQMSGGQKQRIAIARAIIKSPKILLLDEATSALDSESERAVQEAVEIASVGRTTVVVAHRLSTIRNADLIAVVQDGVLVEMGSHDKLMETQNGNYSSLVRHQQTQNDSLDQQETTSYLSSLTHRTSTVNTSSRRSDAPNDEKASTVEQRKYPAPSFRRLLAMNRPEWKQAAVGCLSAVLFGAVQPVYAFAMGSYISVLFLPDHDEIKDKTRTYALCFLGLSVFSFLVNISQHSSFAYMGEHLTKRIRERMLTRMLTFEVGWFDREENSSGALCSRIANDANVVKTLVGDRTALIVQTLSAVIVACTMGLVIAWKLALLMIAIQPIITLCNYTRNVLLRSMSNKANKAQAQSSKLASEAVSNLRTVTAFSSQDRILKMLERAHEGPRRDCVRQSWIAGVVLGTSRSLITCNWALDYWYGGLLVSRGQLTAKQLYETFMILLGTGRAVADAGTMSTDIARGSDTVGSVFAVLDRATEIEPDDPKGHTPERITGRVEIRDVDFFYPSRPDVLVLKEFSINLEQGKSTALVGESGSGKSTVLGLIERFYDPTRGTVKIDGRDIRSYNLRWLRRHIALVSQEPVLFAGTIKDNIAYGASDEISEAEITEAARAANAHDFISALKDGYDTSCGDRGVQLSGGQKQRIAIARAILKDPVVLLLDEATSALDGASEKVVQGSLERVMVGRTSVVVAHRLSTVQNCDLIVVMDKGRVIQTGTHSSMLARGPTGAYYSLVNLQRS